MKTQTEREEDGQVKMEAEIRVTPPPAKECLGLLETKRDEDGFYPRGIGGSMALLTP